MAGKGSLKPPFRLQRPLPVQRALYGHSGDLAGSPKPDTAGKNERQQRHNLYHSHKIRRYVAIARLPYLNDLSFTFPTHYSWLG